MQFKKWLLKLEVGDNPAGVNTATAHQIGPERRLRPNPADVEGKEKINDPEEEEEIESEAMPTFTTRPLPGNKRPMRKKMKKNQ